MNQLPDVSFHLVTSETARLLDRIDPDVFDHAVRPELLTRFLANDMNHLVVAVRDGEVVGMASGISYVHPDKPLQMFVNEVGVADSQRRRGIGARLVQFLLEHARRIGCEEAWVATEIDNLPARALYAATGGSESDDLAVVYAYPLAPREASRE